MAKIKVYNLEGVESGEIELSDSVFNLPKNDVLVHQVYVAHMANKRQVLADTKTRGERAGSGIKPWRQKGTGRARVGSVRTPVWRKGGVAFGPTSERNYKQKINKKMNQKAILTVLSAKAREGEIKVVENLELPENKTKHMASLLNNLKIGKSILIGFSEKELPWTRSSRNLPKVKSMAVNQLNVVDMLHKKHLLLSKESIAYLEKKYAPNSR